jgi:hypothetical protein
MLEEDIKIHRFTGISPEHERRQVRRAGRYERRQVRRTGTTTGTGTGVGGGLVGGADPGTYKP